MFGERLKKPQRKLLVVFRDGKTVVILQIIAKKVKT